MKNFSSYLNFPNIPVNNFFWQKYFSGIDINFSKFMSVINSALKEQSAAVKVPQPEFTPCSTSAWVSFILVVDTPTLHRALD